MTLLAMSVPHHPNTMCTHCRTKPIVGILYHCNACQYKLCEICFRYDTTCSHVSDAWKTPYQPIMMPLSTNIQSNPPIFSFTPAQSFGTGYAFNLFNQNKEVNIEEDGSMII